MRIRPNARLLTAAGLLTAVVTTTGCGPDCYSTCGKLYQEECNFESPGQTQSELLDTCVETCQAALNTPGEVGDYNPYEKQPGDAAITIENDRQAALWMDCIAESACEKLDEGYCAPIW